MSEEALRLRPQVEGFRHTRGMIHLAVGNLEEASRDLEATWRRGQGNELLEAERCYDLGRLWSARGHADYASDYFERAYRAAPESRWGQAAAPRLRAGNRVSDTLDEIL
jgi:tetratricopeptide (TPR) repeat protein